MKVPLSWLKEYVDIVVPVEELAHRLTMAGTEVGGINTIGGWKDCFVGQVAKVEKHPNADRLTLCTVDTGDERLQVVCGAPNVADLQKIAFARIGAVLFDTHSGRWEPLKAARIRGVVSEGMICSQQELGIGDDHTGILVLPEEAPVGTPLSDYLGDHILDLEVTPNRPDCLSILGVAREVAALTGATVREPDCSYPEDGEPVGNLVQVEIADPDLCKRYTASIVLGVEVGPSPRWLQDRLLKAGMRSINNVVDITNYVMLEYNQPLHAFDFQTLKEGRIVVRRARPGEVLLSLDGVEHKLSGSMLVIADARDAVALGGVIGGAQTEMAEGTTNVLLESATFDPINNRRTAQALHISTEASTRFEKGLSPELAPMALRRATQLIHQIAGGKAATGIIDVFPAGASYKAPSLTLTMERLRKVLGVSLPIGKVEAALKSLGFLCQAGDGGTLNVTVPYWRSDIGLEDDLVEEVARIVGYDEIPTTMLSTPIPHQRPRYLEGMRDRAKDLLAAFGMQEVITYPVTSLENLTKVKAVDGGPKPLKLANPLSSQQGYLRTTLRASLLSTLAFNRPHEEGPICIFESGRVFLPEDGELPVEREVLAGLLSGPRGEPHWLSEGGELGFLGFYEAKGIVEKLIDHLGIREWKIEPAQDPILHPGKCAGISADGAPLGVMGEVHPGVAEDFGIEGSPVLIFELDLEALVKAVPEGEQRYSPLGRFPSATRDLSILVDREVPAATVEGIIANQALVSKVRLFDVYTGDNVAAGERSLAYHVYFQSPDRTLTAEEVNAALQDVLLALEREVGAKLRA